MQFLTGIDTPMPDVMKDGGVVWNHHAKWNQWETHWEDDLRWHADNGFRLLRFNIPWSLIQPKQNIFDFTVLGPQIELARKLGIEIVYPLAHFNYPYWICRDDELHPTLASGLADALALYAEVAKREFSFHYIIPIVEISIDCMLRSADSRWADHSGVWAPHARGVREVMEHNLTRAFVTAAANLQHRSGSLILCSEPASALDIVKNISRYCDILGMDYYPKFHRHPKNGEPDLSDRLKQWSILFKRPIAITEYGIPETYDWDRQRDQPDLHIRAGDCRNRTQAAKYLFREIRKAKQAGVTIPFAGWFPSIDNRGWESLLTKDPGNAAGNRAGIVDLEWEDSKLRRVPCAELVAELHTLSDYKQAKEASTST